MKNNATNMRIDEMHYDRLTLVFGEYAGKAHAPVNPAATIVAVKGGPVENPITTALAGALERLGLAKKSAPASKATADEAIENAGLSALFNLLYNLECDTYSMVGAGLDDAAKKAAVTALVASFYEAALSLIGSIFTEKSMAIDAAQKSGTAPDADAVEKQLDVLDGVIAAANKSREALAKFVAAPPENAPAGDTAKVEPPVEGEKAAVVEPPAAKPADGQPDVAALVAEAVKAVDFASIVGEAVKAAVTPLETKVGEVTSRAEAAEKAAADAKAAQGVAEKALTDAVGDARGRQTTGGHEDGVEAAKKSAADPALATAAAKNEPTILGAIQVLHGSKPVVAA